MAARRGIALLLVAGVLSVLGVTATLVATLAQIERRATRQRVYATRALLLARAGLEDALARLDAGQDPDDPAHRYLGEDHDASGSLDGPEVAAETFRPGRLDTASCPASHALRPSFPVMHQAGITPLPALRQHDGRDRGFSGCLGSDSYALRVMRPGLFVNGGDPAAPPGAGYNPVLRRILGTLAEAIDREDGLNDALPVDEIDGWRLIDLRPASGWRQMTEIRDLALNGTASKWQALEPYLTLDAWVDRKVIRPNADPSLMHRAYRSWADLRLGRWHDAATGASGPAIRNAPALEARAPVDLAWARHQRPVLIALLAGLQGLWLDETAAGNLEGTDDLGHLRPAGIPLDWSQPTDPCRQVADQILATTSDLRTWSQWHDFTDALVLNATPSEQERQARRDLLKANFNPNTDLNKFNPCPSLARLIDKSDLLAYSAEFNLTPRGGGRVSAAGRVLDAGGRILAARTLSAEIAPHLLCRLTTQSEFVAGDLGNLAVAGDENAFRTYGQSPYITRSQGTGRTFGHRHVGNPGVSLQTAPEPHTVAVPASYDGQILLATLETADGEWGPSQMFLASWSQSFDADHSGGGGQLGNVSPDVSQPSPQSLLWDAATPGTLFPDGIYVERGRIPGYEAPGNMAPHRGVISFWLKRNYALPSSRRHLFLNHTRTDGDPANTAAFTLTDVFNDGPSLYALYPPGAFCLFFENDYESDGGEQGRCTPIQDTPPHRWHLLTCLWDMEPPVQPIGEGDLSIRILVDRGTESPRKRNTPDLYQPGCSGPSVDFTVQSGSPAIFHLGQRGFSPYGGNAGHLAWHGAPDSTFDEFAIYDFGPNAGDDAPILQAELLAQDRFEIGRYYKESAYLGLLAPPGANRAGEYFSAPIALGDVRIRGLSWTQVVPPGLRRPQGPYAVPEDADAGPEGAIAFELADLPGSGYASDTSNAPVASFLRAAAWSPVGRRIRDPFRLHAVFQPNLDPATLADRGILDPLVLDDVTVVYEKPEGAGFLSLSWE